MRLKIYKTKMNNNLSKQKEKQKTINRTDTKISLLIDTVFENGQQVKITSWSIP